MNQELNYEKLIVDTNPIKIRLLSDIYIVYNKRGGYLPAIDFIEIKTKITYSLFVGARSIAKGLEDLRIENNDQIIGIELWIERKGTAKFDGYILELA